MLQSRKPCLYITQDSFVCPNYFLAFLNQHKEIFTKEIYKFFEKSFSKEKNVQPHTIIRMIQAVLNTKNELYLFIDFGRVHSSGDDGAYLKCLLHVSHVYSDEVGLLRKIITVSSGFSMARANPMFSRPLKEICLKIYRLVEECYTLKIVTGYTEVEADKIIVHLNMAGIDVDEIKKLAGTNPLLLSLLKNTTDLSHYKHKVQDEIQCFLQNNLHVVKDPRGISDFFAYYKWDTGRLYIHLTLQGRKFTAEQYNDYVSTWLYHSNLLIDTGDHLMKFNFPGMGEALVHLFRTLMPKIPDVQELAMTKRSVGGFLFEKIFIDHILKDSKVCVQINSLHGLVNSTEMVNLTMVTVLPFVGSNFLNNTLYELYSCHAAFDFVGYLTGTSANYLVFMQLSLSTYVAHGAKFDDILTHSPKKDHLRKDEPSQLNLLQFYSYRARHLYEQDVNPNVLLLYISPREDQALIPTLQDKLKHTFSQYFKSFNFFVGIAPQNSPFFVNFL